MIIKILSGQWVIVRLKDKEPLLYTASNLKDIAIRKFENKEKIKFNTGRGLYKAVNVDISVKDLSLED